jgi:uncharacterized protein (TIGR02271 family)
MHALRFLIPKSEQDRRRIMDRTLIHQGQHVLSADGKKLGTVIALDDDGFSVEKGIFFPREMAFRYEDINNVRDDQIYLWRNKADLEAGAPLARDEELTEEGGAELESGTDMEEAGMRDTGITEETRVPLAEEELRAAKRIEETGAVEIKKEVITEQRTVEIPVQREEVKVERVPASGAAASGAFTEETVRIPIHEEKVEVTKTPVVKEEVRVSKTTHPESRTVTEEVKREVADVKNKRTGKREGEKDMR